jgi:hypothetical protein
MVVSAFALVISIAPEVSATAPTITVYGISPADAEIGTRIQTWLTYTDADDDAPTYVRCERSTLPNVAGLQIPVNTMLANDSGDTTYTDGKQYYFNWYYFPFAGTGFIAFMVKSGADAQVNEFVVEYQEPAPKVKHSGVTPMNNTAGNYTFFTNFTDQMYGVPGYVRVVIDGVSHNMGKNNSTQTTWITGVDYNYTEYLGIGNHTYSFHCTSQYNKSGEQSTGVFWLIIGIPTGGGTSISLPMLIIIAVLIGAIVVVWRQT